MDCRKWEQRLDDYLAGVLTAAEQSLADEHLANCPRCRRLLAVARETIDALGGTETQDLTAAILEKTSGRACDRVHDMLGDLAEGTLPAQDAELVRIHLQHCQPCEQIAVTLTWLLPELKTMAELSPDRRFTADVIAATSDSGRRLRRWRERIEERWQLLMARPRFALEAAYVGMMVLVGLFGTPVSPFQEAPLQALEVVEAGPTVVSTMIAKPLGRAPSSLWNLGGDAWNATGRHLVDAAENGWTGLQQRSRRAAPALGDAKEHGQAWGDAILHGKFMEAAGHASRTQQSLLRAWERWRGSDADAGGAPSTDPSESAEQDAGASDSS